MISVTNSVRCLWQAYGNMPEINPLIVHTQKNVYLSTFSVPGLFEYACLYFFEISITFLIHFNLMKSNIYGSLSRLTAFNCKRGVLHQSRAKTQNFSQP